MKYLALLLLVGCGQMNVSDSEHEVYVHGKTEHVITLDLSVCDEVSKEKRDECILGMVHALEAALKQQEAE